MIQTVYRDVECKEQPMRYALIIDDHPIVSNGLVQFLKGHPLLQDAVADSSVEKAIGRFGELGEPAVVLLDYWLVSGASDQSIRSLKTHWPRIKILVMSGDSNPALIEKLKSCGADGFVHKQESPATFSRAISAILANRLWFETDIPRSTDFSMASNIELTVEELGLTPRQGEILHYLLRAFPNKKISSILNISENTVKEHVTLLLQKMGVTNRVELISKMRGSHFVEKDNE